MSWSEYSYRDREALEMALAESLRAQIDEAIAERGHAVLALAGGSTPLSLYRRLAAATLGWSRVTLLPTDERCVPHTHAACNLSALQTVFAEAGGVRWMALTPDDGDPERAMALANANLAGQAEAFDVVLLGMGADAHTASLFPHAAALPAALAEGAPDALRIDPLPLPPEAPFARISLSAARLKRTRALQLMIVGDEKREALRRAQASHDALATPISALLHAEDARLHIHWSP